MQLRKLSLRGWRNLAPLDLELDPRLNVFVGENAQGKTNLLEAIDYLATLRSFRTRHAEELIAFASTHAELHGLLERRLLDHTIDVELRAAARRVQVSGKPVRAASAYASLIGATLFVPDDLALPRASPSLRRRFVDRAVFSLVPLYLGEVRDFERVLRQRNAALRQGRIPLVEAFDEPLARSASRLVSRRRQALLTLGPELQESFAAITGTPLAASLGYRCIDWQAGEGDAEEAVAQTLLRRLHEEQRRDLARGHTTLGPQADDVDLLLDGRLVRSHASQGQTRAFVLALKIAEIRAYHAVWGDFPLLLLDDVASELDETRTRFLFEYVAGISAQVFLTTTDPELVPWSGSGRRWRVQAGGYQAL